MHRRHFMAAAMAAPAFIASARADDIVPVTDTDEWRQFEVTTRVTLLDAPGPAQLWLPLAQTADGYQSAGALSWTTGQNADVVDPVRDDRYGALMLKVDFSSGVSGTPDTAHPPRHGVSGGAQQEATKTIVVVQRVATRTRGATPFVPLTMAEHRFWTESTPSAPTDGLVREMALRITAGQVGDRARLRALYDWVVDNTYRRTETPGCGTGDYASMLQSGSFGGKCADINGLLVGLARSIGLPARDVYGIRVGASHLAATLGRIGNISKAQHCRAEVFLQGEGWFPVDPADVRKVILEQALGADGDVVRSLRERLFGQWEMNWVGYNCATDIELPDSGGRRPNFAFLMYPCAFTSSGQPDCLEPGQFHYEITSRELTA